MKGTNDAPASQSFLTPGQLVRLPKTLEALGIPRSSFYAGIKKGLFPKPVKLGERTAAWRSDDLIKIINEGVEL